MSDIVFTVFNVALSLFQLLNFYTRSQRKTKTIFLFNATLYGTLTQLPATDDKKNKRRSFAVDWSTVHEGFLVRHLFAR